MKPADWLVCAFQLTAMLVGVVIGATCPLLFIQVATGVIVIGAVACFAMVLRR